jgi:hypothetical protein
MGSGIRIQFGLFGQALFAGDRAGGAGAAPSHNEAEDGLAQHAGLMVRLVGAKYPTRGDGSAPGGCGSTASLQRTG